MNILPTVSLMLSKYFMRKDTRCEGPSIENAFDILVNKQKIVEKTIQNMTSYMQ